MRWGFNFTCIRYDIKGIVKRLKVNNEVKVSVSVRDGKFHCEWEKNEKIESLSILVPRCKRF